MTTRGGRLIAITGFAICWRFERISQVAALPAAWPVACSSTALMASGEIIISALDTRTGWSTVQTFYTSPITVGSDRSNSFHIDSDLVAPHHAEITFTHREVVLRSLVGQDRTILNGEPVRISSSASIEDGAVVLVGPVRLTVLLGAEIAARRTWSKDDSVPRLGLCLTLALDEPNADLGDEGGSDNRQLRRANELLLMFVSALIMARHYLPSSANRGLARFRDPTEAMTYLTDLAASGRVEELGDHLAELVTSLGRLATPIERWPV